MGPFAGGALAGDLPAVISRIRDISLTTAIELFASLVQAEYACRQDRPVITNLATADLGEKSLQWLYHHSILRESEVILGECYQIRSEIANSFSPARYAEGCSALGETRGAKLCQW